MDSGNGPVGTNHSDLNPFSDLIIAMLAVNNFTLERAYSLRDSLDEQGLLNVQTIAELSIEELSSALARAGYRRGSFMNPLFAERIRKVAVEAVRQGKGLKDVLISGDRANVEAALLPLPGIGPTVIRNYLLLRG